MPIDELSTNPGVPGVKGRHAGAGFGVFGHGADNTGVVGESDRGHGVVGQAHGNAFGVFGLSDANTGVVGESKKGHGVVGQAHGDAFGVFGTSDANTGVVGESKKGHGVVGIAHDPAATGVLGRGKSAGRFEGDVDVTGSVRVQVDVQLVGADVAEQFGVVGELEAEPGCVVILAGDDQVRVSDQPYDRKVAGVVSGAGNYRPALVLDQRNDRSRRALALTGKVWCKVDADSGPVAVGDMLTTSSVPGHAMRAADQSRAFGAVIGKALGNLESGRGLLPILVALQ